MIFGIYAHRLIGAQGFNVGLHCSGKTASEVKGLRNSTMSFQQQTNSFIEL